MKLYIDTSDNLKTVVQLDEEVFEKNYQTPREQDVMGLLLEVFESKGLAATDISQIEFNPGPGSFTGLRVGASIANALGFALQVPVNQKPVGQVALPEYGAEASITPPKTKK